MKEYDQINDYNRTMSTIILTWYTFFITSNLFAIGIISSKYTTGQLSKQYFMLGISLVFFIVNILGIIGTFQVKKYIHNRIDRINSILNELINSTDITSPVKFELVKTILLLMIFSLLSIAGFWVFISIRIIF